MNVYKDGFMEVDGLAPVAGSRPGMRTIVMPKLLRSLEVGATILVLIPILVFVYGIAIWNFIWNEPR